MLFPQQKDGKQVHYCWVKKYISDTVYVICICNRCHRTLLPKKKMKNSIYSVCCLLLSYSKRGSPCWLLAGNKILVWQRSAFTAVISPDDEKCGTLMEFLNLSLSLYSLHPSTSSFLFQMLLNFYHQKSIIQLLVQKIKNT